MKTVRTFLRALAFAAGFALAPAVWAADSQYDLFGITSVQAFIGTGMASPRDNVNAVSVSDLYTFR